MTRFAIRNGARLCAALCSVSALAQVTYEPGGGQVNISGATLFEPFFQVPASTNDFIDVDNDGISGFDAMRVPPVDTLARQYTGGGFTTYWLVNYRGVGSVNGLNEFVAYATCGSIPHNVPSTAWINQVRYANGTRLLGHGPDCNGNGQQDDSGTPICQDSIDMAVLDVPSSWAIVGPTGTPNWARNPGEAGYGVNPINSWDTGWVSAMQNLCRTCTSGAVCLNENIGSPDELTIFNYRAAWAPIGIIANRGVSRSDLNNDGVQGDINVTDLQHLFTTGRLRSGENLEGVTRSVGSGTRNGAMNTLGVDTAWGRGDNLGSEWLGPVPPQLGAGRQSTNAEGSGDMENVIRYSRLGVGYSGLAGTGRAVQDAANGQYEILNLKFDDRGGTGYVRPNVQSIVQNCSVNTGYQVGGPETFVTLGDPFETNSLSPAYMTNQNAADYLRNIEASVAAFAGNPVLSANNNMPGEYLGIAFFQLNALGCLPDDANPSSFVANASLNAALQTYTLNNNRFGVGFDTPAYGSANAAGQVPTRRNLPGGYLDGQPVNYAYKSHAGVLFNIGPNLRLAQRNRVQGDFNADGLRNVNDVARMMVAYTSPLDFEVGESGFPLPGDQGEQTGGNVVIVHVIGDFNGSGNFDAADVRYFADGLALDPAFNCNAEFGATLNRKLGFARVDQSWDAQPTGDDNFFDTTLATGKPYAAGDSRGDVAGNTTAPGADPRGADGVVDAEDIDYVYGNFGDWSDTDEAVLMDLSADMTGPGAGCTLVVNQADVDELVRVILCTEYGDADLDGDVDSADVAIVNASIANPPADASWANGDFNGDGVVNAADLTLANDNLGFNSACLGGLLGDLNCDGVVNNFDIDPFVLALTDAEGYSEAFPNCDRANADANGDGVVNNFDIDPFVGLLTG